MEEQGKIPEGIFSHVSIKNALTANNIKKIGNQIPGYNLPTPGLNNTSLIFFLYVTRNSGVGINWLWLRSS